MWNEICKDYIPVDKYLVDINGNMIDRGTIVKDENGFEYKFKWDTENQEWIAESLRENNKTYQMYQERINRNNFKVVNN